MDFDDRLSRQQKEIETIRADLDETRAGLDAIAQRLLRLTAGQEALELQTALLSSEAENGALRPTSALAVSNEAVASSEALEKLQSQLNELSQASLTTATRAKSRSDMLEGRIQELHDAGRRLETAVSDLRKNVSPPNKADLTKSAWRGLVDDVSSLKTARGITEDRMGQLEKRREELLGRLKALNLQQVRHDQDVRRIEKQLKRLAVLVVTVGLLAAGLLMWLVSNA